MQPIHEKPIYERKNSHIETVLNQPVTSACTTGFEQFQFEHQALPNLNLGDIDLRSKFLGSLLKAPLLISAMTGGSHYGERINTHLAEAAEQLGIALAVGSQRIALEGGNASGLDTTLRKKAPSVPIFANIGAAQLNRGYGAEELKRAIDMVDANALVIHLNPLQEALQPSGDAQWAGLLARIEQLSRSVTYPIIVKEVGFGISAGLAQKLMNAGVSAVDVAGAGGTNWALVETRKHGSPTVNHLGDAFADWGIPTALALMQSRKLCPGLPLIASGGIRNGVQVAKALRMGADLVGLAAPLLSAAMTNTEAVIQQVESLLAQLRIACFVTGSSNISQLKQARLFHTGSWEPCLE